MEKNEMRTSMIHRLQDLVKDKERKKEKEKKIYTHFFSSKQWLEANVVAVTLANELELDTDPLIQKGFEEKKTLVVPKTLSKRRMVFYELTKDTVFEQSAFGVREPLSTVSYEKSAIDLIVVPGLIFSSKGYRIGFGGGYYDRYLADYSGQTCSLVFSEQLCNDWLPESFDQPVQTLFTENKVIH